MTLDGLNTVRFEAPIAQIDELVAMARRWTHTLAHQAEHAGCTSTGEVLHEAMRSLDDVRSYLDEAKLVLDVDETGGTIIEIDEG